MAIPSFVLYVLATAGLFSTTYLITICVKNLFYYLKYKEYPTDILEEKYNILKQENQRLSNKIEKLERENEDMTRAVLQRIT